MMNNYELYIESPPIRKALRGSFKKNGQKKYLSSFEIKEIVNLYPDKFNYELAKLFNVSESTILKLRRKYNLSKSERIMDAERFHPGHKPFNIGKNYIHNSSTKFKQGHMPKNHRPVGSKRLTKDGYYEMKIAEPKKWETVHRVIWQRHYGEIPEGMIIIFKDGNNVDISNLEMISRKENMERNRNYKKSSETMKSLWRIEKLRNKYGMKRYTKLRIN